MTLWIDADGCPVVALAARIAAKFNIEAVIVKNYSHEINSPTARIVTVDKVRDSADFYIANHLLSGDIVITQDNGLAAMVLAKRGLCLNQNGIRITDDTIGLLLDRRHLHQELRRKHGVHAGKAPKRSAALNDAFERALTELLEEQHFQALHPSGKAPVL